VTPEFEERVEEIAEVTWSDENTTIYPSLRAAVNGVAEIQSNGDVTAVQIKMLADHTVGGSGAMADVTITEDMEFVLDLNGCTINFGDYNMNNQGTVTIKDNSLKQTGKMIFGEDIEAASTSAGILENNGLLTVESGAIIGNNQDMLIYNKRMLDVTGGEIRNTYGSAIFNLDGEEDGANVDPNMGSSWSTTRGGVLEIEAGRVIGGSNGYGVYQDNDVMYSVNVKELGEPENYGEGKENYISSIRLSKRNASVNVSGFLENCNSDEVPVKILLSICDEAQAGDLILTTNVTNQDKTLRHYREHFTLSDDSMFIAVSDNEENKARLKKRVDSVKLDIPFDRNTFIYNDTLIVLTYMLDADGEVVTDATGTVYYFTADENTVWEEIWDDENKAFKEKDDGSGEYYSFSDAIAYQEVDEGIVERTVVNKHYEAGAHFLAAIYVGDDYYDKYSYGAERNGYETPLASNMQEFEVVQKPLTQSMLDADDITKPYTGQNYASWLPVNVSLRDSYSLSLNTDYYIQLAVYNYTIQDAGEYDITIHGIGNYSGTVDLKFTVEQYTDALNVSLSQEYYLSAPDIVFEGSGATASVTDIYGNTLSTDDFTYKIYTLDENGDIDEDIEPSTEAPSEVGMYRMVVNGSGGNYSEVAEGGVNFVIIKTDGALSVETDDGEFVYNGYDKYVDVESVPEGTADENVRSLDVYGTVDDEPIKLTYGSHYLVSWGGSIRPNSAGNYTLLIIGTDMFAGDYSAKIMSVSKYELDENNTSVIFTDGDGAETSEFEYDGTAHYANVKIHGGVPDDVNLLSRFEQDKDYLVSYSGKKLTTDESSGNAVLDESQYINVTRDENDNVIAGSEVEISGTGVNYSGSFTKKYTIVPRDMEKYSDEITASVTDISFSGAANEPVIIVEDNCSTIQDKHLEEGTDFEVTYEAVDDDASLITVNGKGYPYSSGNYKAIISGIGNYSGTITQEFSMTGYSGGIIVSLSPSVYGYTGQAVQLVTLSVTNDNGIALEEGVDYTLSYSLRSDPDTSVDAVQVGEYYVNVTGIGNYAGHSGRAEFDIISTSGLVSIVLKD
ncbi:MAG: hypothetical protein LIO59_01975, partial [Oscillospiraceae bacterium]|nr:hypothetical protein [Oscillospiraceae bacterium]